MPKGSPSKRTERTQRYHDKVGLISKSFKLKKEIVEAFADACQKAGVSQAGQLTRMMQEFIDQQNNQEIQS